eukprot:gene6906-9458_t
MSSNYNSKTAEKQKLLNLNNTKNNSGNSKTAFSIPPDDETKDEKSYTLVIAFFLMLLFQLGNRIFGRLQTFPMHNYPLFMNMLSTVIYVPLCFMYIFPIVWWTKNIAQEQLDIPKFKFAVMGAYDSLAGIMQTFAVNYISNSSTIVLVQQSAIPISMLISKIALQSVYTMAQYIGAAVVLFGIVVVLIPNFFSDPNSTGTSSSSSTSEGNYELAWILVLVVSCVPMCLSSVYKEKALGEMEIDIIYLNGWVAVFQSLFALPLCFPSAEIINLPIHEILPNMLNGIRCWMGYNSITADNNPYGQPLDDCSMAPYFVTTYLLFNIVYNFLIVIILKHGSANILWMASTVIVPLSNVAFSLNFMPGHQPLKSLDIVGLFVIMFGLIIYRFSASIISIWQSLTGVKKGLQEMEDDKMARRIAILAEKKQVKYVGLNQLESLQSLVDTRIQREQRLNLFRSPSQIRGSLLYRLGIPPSPQIMLGQGGPRLSFIDSRSNSIKPIKASPNIYPGGYQQKYIKIDRIRSIDPTVRGIKRTYMEFILLEAGQVAHTRKLQKLQRLILKTNQKLNISCEGVCSMILDANFA